LFSFIHMRNPNKSSLPSNNHILVVILSSSFKIPYHFPPSMKQLGKLIFSCQQDDFILGKYSTYILFKFGPSNFFSFDKGKGVYVHCGF
jgi:hypothetical protein